METYWEQLVPIALLLVEVMLEATKYFYDFLKLSCDLSHDHGRQEMHYSGF